MEFTELLTVPGAAVGAGLLVQVAKILGLPGRWARRSAVIAGTLILLVATGMTGGVSAAEWMAAGFAGLTAGLAAVAAYDSATG